MQHKLKLEKEDNCESNKRGLVFFNPKQTHDLPEKTNDSNLKANG